LIAYLRNENDDMVSNHEEKGKHHSHVFSRKTKPAMHAGLVKAEPQCYSGYGTGLAFHDGGDQTYCG
jgi:hypothetical protein